MTNVILNPGAGGSTLATDTVGGIEHQIVKIGVSAAGAAPTQVSSTDPLPVTGPVTDAQLRASAVPVSGPLTDAQLRASAVPISGALTDAQLRATPVPISGTVTANAGTNLNTSLLLLDATFTARLNTQGQKAMAASTPVVIASDQAAFPVTANAGTNLNTSALLLDATFTGRINSQGQKAMAASTPVVIASDQSAIPVSGSVSVGGVVSTKTDLSPSAPASTTVGVASAQAVAANGSRKGLHVRNTSTAGQRISLSMSGAATLDDGITLYPQDVFEMGEYDFDQGAINAIASAGSARLSVQEYA